MAVESTQQIAPQQAENAPVERWRFTVADFYRLGELGILPHDARVELINGDVVKMPPIGSHHNGSVMTLDEVLRERLGRRVSISVQGPLVVPNYGTPQPDIVVLKRRDDQYRSQNPSADDALLVIEVSDSTLGHDWDTKAPIYAQAGIADYWIVDLAHAQVLVLRKPVDGVYQSVETLAAGATLQPLAFPDVNVAVSEILA